MIITLPKYLQNKPFTYQEARERGINQYAIRSLIACGALERIERGLYRVTGNDTSDEELYRRATKRAGESATVCLLSALSHYELIDEIPKQVWLMMEAKKRVKSASIRLYRARNPRWGVGIVSKNGYSITSVERTVVEALSLKAVLPIRVGIDALKRAIATKRTTAAKVLSVADGLGVKHRILSYIEAIV